MKIKRSLTVFGLVLLVSLLAVGLAQAAAVVLDTFDDGPQSFTVDFGAPNGSGVAAGSMLNSERDVAVQWISGDLVQLRIDQGAPPGSNRLAFSQADSTTGSATITYDGADGNPTVLSQFAAPVDFTGGGTNDGIHMEVPFDDNLIDVVFTVYSSLTDFSSFRLDLPGGITAANSHVDFFIPFSQFAVEGGAGASFNGVTAIQIFVDGTVAAGADLSVEFIELDSFREFGDAPASYGNPSHIPQGLRFGINADSEAAATPTADATGDDQVAGTAVDDEDGVRPTPGFLWRPGAVGGGNGGSLDFIINGCFTTCYVNGWIDWNNNGSFEVGERAVTDVPTTNSSFNNWQTLRFNIPAGAVVANGTFLARFRIYPASQGGAASPTTVDVFNGEVEDYRWSFGPTAVTLTEFTARPSQASLLLTLAACILLVGLGGLAVARRLR
jgi:hypothetical protein